MATKKFRISPNPKTDADLLEDLKRIMSKGIWRIKDLSAKLHVGEHRLHRLLGMFANDYCSKVDDKVRAKCKKNCKCNAEKAVPADIPEDASTMICVTRLPSPKMIPAFIVYLTECIEKALDVIKY